MCEKGIELGAWGANKCSLLGVEGMSTGEPEAKLERKMGLRVGEALLQGPPPCLQERRLTIKRCYIGYEISKSRGCKYSLGMQPLVLYKLCMLTDGNGLL